MKVTTVHRITIAAQCPHGASDIYDVEFHLTDRVLTVERIHDTLEELTRTPCYQEDLTKALATGLACTVVTRGRHGLFATECRAEGSL